MSNRSQYRTLSRQWIVEKWTSSIVYRIVDKLISKRYRRRIKNDEFTILCSNCIGGTIYHRLGKQFLSPTIDLFFTQPDFVSFCVNLDYYLGKELVFIDNQEGFPLAHLEGSESDDIPTITIGFLHEKDESNAQIKWERRKQRIKYDNLFIIAYKLDGVTTEQLRRLEQVKCRNKVVLTAEPIPEISWSYCIKPDRRSKLPYSYLGKDIFGVRYYEKKFDFVAFLNCTMQDKQKKNLQTKDENRLNNPSLCKKAKAD